MKQAILAGASVVLVAAAAGAATLTYSDSYSGQTEFATEGSGNPLDVSPLAEALTLSKFDASLGVLTGVTVNLDMGFRSEGALTSNAAERMTGRLQEEMEINFASAEIEAIRGAVGAGSDSGFVTLSANEVVPITLNSNANGRYILSDRVGDFLGGPDDDFTIDFFSTVMTTITGGGGNLDFTLATEGFIEAEVVYTYDAIVSAVPLPATLPLALAGLAGLAWVSRSRRAHA